MRLTDSFSFRPIGQPMLVESADGTQLLRRSGVFQNYKIFNQNKRRYGKPLWERQLAEGSPFRKRLAAREVLGLLEHPEDGTTKLDRSPSHVIVEVHIATDEEIRNSGGELEEGDIIGTFEVFNTRNGQDLKALIEGRAGFGVSSRGSGTVRNVEEGLDVNDDFELDTWDVVYNPSVLRAKPRNESVEEGAVAFNDWFEKNAASLRKQYDQYKTINTSPKSFDDWAKERFNSHADFRSMSECEIGNKVIVVGGAHDGATGVISATSGNTVKVEIGEPDEKGAVKTITVQHNEVKLAEATSYTPDRVSSDLKAFANDWDTFVAEDGLEKTKRRFKVLINKATELGMKVVNNYPNGDPLSEISIPETVKPPGGGETALQNAGKLTESTSMNPLQLEVLNMVRTPVKGLKPSELSVVFESIRALRSKVNKAITENADFSTDGQKLITKLNEFEDELDAAPASAEAPIPAAAGAEGEEGEGEVIDASQELDLLKRAQEKLAANAEDEESVAIADELSDLVAAIEPELTVTAEESVAVKQIKRQLAINESRQKRLAETTANLLERYKALRELSTQGSATNLGEGKEESLIEWQNAARDLASRYNRDMLRTGIGLLKIKHPALYESLKDKIAECKTFKQFEALVEQPLTEAVKPAPKPTEPLVEGAPAPKPAPVVPKEEETLSEAAVSAIAIATRNRKTA